METQKTINIKDKMEDKKKIKILCKSVFYQRLSLISSRIIPREL